MAGFGRSFKGWAPGRSTSKYRNIPCTIEGIRFQSQREGRRYWEYRQEEKAGVLKILALQKPFPFVHGGIKICEYRADFIIMYKVGPNAGIELVVDAKGKRTNEYILKKKMMKAFYGIDIVEV